MSARRHGRLTAATFGLAGVLFAAGGLGFLGDNHGRAADEAPPGAPAARGDLGASLVALQTRLREQPNDSGAWASLGLAYVEQAKATVDPSYYPKADGALRRSLKLDTK